MLSEYLVVLRNSLTREVKNVVRECESDELMVMIWKSYNTRSLQLFWRDTDDEIELISIQRIDSVTEAETLYEMSRM